ncbi:hypothetical protein GIB67_041484 [Kingdonia uniflora]|uniref:Uncharacterized protein n=1 Tax=Kingdonia uniflora TaxID=39325 RepID=A0A7J7LRT0_9MAGN|nr:hypothetical protein GIB67_041484 [Kingdonia uniflora]
MPDGRKGSHKYGRDPFMDDDDKCSSEYPLDKKGTNHFRDPVKKHNIYTEGCTSGGQRRRGTITSEKPLQFIPWLRRQLENETLENEKVSVLKRLADGPGHNAISYKAYRANGFVFHAKGSKSSTITQNSGVTMKAIMTFISRKSDPNGVEDETTYYEVVKEILELENFDFQETRKKNPKVPVFRTNVYLATHTRVGGSSLTPELDVELEKIRNICIAEPKTVNLDIDNDPVVQVCGKDIKGRTRSCRLNVSREEVLSSCHLRDQLLQEKTVRLTLKEDLVHVKDKLTTMDEKLSSLVTGRQATSGPATFNVRIYPP